MDEKVNEIRGGGSERRRVEGEREGEGRGLVIKWSLSIQATAACNLCASKGRVSISRMLPSFSFKSL